MPRFFADPGFENYALSSGGFVKPTSGPWQFVHDAGVVEPFAANSSTGAVYTWTAVFPAVEGQQYASTYASLDSLSQVASFDTAGEFMISAYAAAPDGTVRIHPQDAPLTLADGEFTFALGGMAIGSTNIVPKGSSWNLYSAVFSIATPGNYTLRIWNTKTAPYFINYDAFAIQPIPEPTAFQLALVFGIVVAGVKALRRRRR